MLTEEQAALVERSVPADIILESSGARGNAMKQMTRAFQINLTALGLLALLIGAFLIYNTMTLAVLQRRSQDCNCPYSWPDPPGTAEYGPGRGRGDRGPGDSAGISRRNLAEQAPGWPGVANTE